MRREFFRNLDGVQAVRFGYWSVLLSLICLTAVGQQKALQKEDNGLSDHFQAQFIANNNNVLAAIPDAKRIDLSGTWQFKIDSLDKGESEGWFNNDFKETISLPGSMTTNNKGDDISLTTPWTGQIVDSSWFFDPGYAPYRQPGNIKVPFWLQPVKYYKGAAWYQKEVNIPADWKGHPIELSVERAHWETTVWVDGQKAGSENSLSTAHVYDLSRLLPPGRHRISMRVDNRTKEVNVGMNSHSITDHTQGNWNGMIGKIQLIEKPLIYLEDVQVFPDIKNNKVNVRVRVVNRSKIKTGVTLNVSAQTTGGVNSVKLAPMNKTLQVPVDSSTVELQYAMGSNPMLWDEFHPNLYKLTVLMKPATGKPDTQSSKKEVQFGMREFKASGTQFIINGRKTFLRGTLECAIFPLTGYPPTDKAAWSRIFKIARAYGLNHMRFHSWCPPEAAFAAADEAGFYLQVECGSWANSGATVGDGKPLDAYLYRESNRIVAAYGNHPSFCMMAYGNEPAGEHLTDYLTRFVQYWKEKDPRRLYTTAAGWPVIAESDYNSTPDPRIQAWGAGLKSIINAKPPNTDYDWRNIIAKWQHPTVSHEIGQWCVYPDFKEIKDYTGVMKAKNFEIFQDKLNNSGLGNLADSFLLASGKLQVLCYKADIEAALRTPGFGGFQLLDLHDFPGQGTALVGVLSPFWKEKGYVTSDEYSRFCNAVVPLARLPKMIWLNNETLNAKIEIANFGIASLNAIKPTWTLQDQNGNKIKSGVLPVTDIALGNDIQLGTIQVPLNNIRKASELTLTVRVGQHQNSWRVFVYPAETPAAHDVLVTQQLNQKALATLASGGKVLLSIKKGMLREDKGGKIPIGFSSIFWNTAWTHGQPPHSLGILCNPKHPALADFPTDYYASWQWWDGMSHSSAIELDSVSNAIRPIVRVIDDWVTARSLGLIFECRVGAGKLIVTGIDLIRDEKNRPEARQLKYSLMHYMESDSFDPAVEVPVKKITSLFKAE